MEHICTIWQIEIFNQICFLALPHHIEKGWEFLDNQKHLFYILQN